MKKGSLKSIRLTRRRFRVLAAALAVLSVSVIIAWPVLAAPPAPELLDPTTIPKYVNQLTGPPPVYVPREIRGKGGEVIQHSYTVLMKSFMQQILPPGYPATRVWGYGGVAKDAVTGAPLGFVQNSPGPSFEPVRGIPAYVNWQNRISSSHMFAVDPTLHWANPNNLSMPEYPFEPYPPGYPEAQWPVPLVTHLHGGEVKSTYDGHPDAWFTINAIHGPAYNTARKGNGGNTALFVYPNEQPPTTLWYHDHALGITRLNVMSGLAGFYLLRDPGDEVAELLPSGEYEIPIAIQDRIFMTDGSMYFPSEGNNPDIHPYWSPEFFGDVSMVNGLVWPNMDVKQGQYRLRLLDGSNARFYNASFRVKIGEDDLGNPESYGALIPFTQIGSDGGYLKSAADLEYLIIAPGERADILIDFSGLDAGTKVIMRNDAYAPFKGGSKEGDPPGTMVQIMQFTVTDEEGFEPQTLPDPLNEDLDNGWPTLPEPVLNRTLVLVEVMSPADEPEMILLNGQKWGADVSETPVLGTTEEWIIVNPTEDTHPIHLHLTQFQLVSRQSIDVDEYWDDWIGSNIDGSDTGEPPWYNDWPVVEVEVTPYLEGAPMSPPDNELGWKDTIQAHPGQVTVIRVRFSPIDGSEDYPFDATEGPGYVWHCHILDHEDNEMMRPYKVLP